MNHRCPHFSISKIIFSVLFLLTISFESRSQATYPFSGNGGQVALWSPINKCGSSSSFQYKWIGDACVYPGSGFNGGNPYGTVTSIAWYCNGGSLTSVTSGNPIPIKIYLKQTTATTMAAQTWASAISGATLVYSGNTPLTINVGTWYTPALCTPFNWTSDNLLVLVECDWGIWGVPNECGTSPNWEYNDVVANTHEEWFTNTSAAALAASTGAVDQYRADVRVVVGGSVGGSPATANAGGNHTLCQGQNVTLSGSGTGSYNWSPSTGLSCTTCAAPVASPTTTTSYTLTTSNACGTATDIATVTVSPLPTVNAGADKTICSGQSATLNGSGSGPYVWSPSGTLSNANISNPVASPTITTIYTLSATNACGTMNDAATVVVNNVPSPNAGPDKTICAGKNTVLNGSGGGPYVWTPSGTLSNPNIASPTASPTTFTSYTLSSTNGCGTGTDIVDVYVNAAPTANAGGNQTVCNGQSVTLNASGGGTYVWSPATGLSNPNIANPVASPTTPTNYSVTVTNGAGCTATASANVTVNSLPAASAGANQTVCSGGTVTLTASGGGTYVWNTGATSASITDNPTSNTGYTVTVANASGCSATATTSVVIGGNPTASISGSSTVCSGNSATLAASGGSSYQWNTGQTTAVINPVVTTTTTYSVTVANGSCTSTTAITVTPATAPTANISGNTNICIGDIATLTASGGGNYVWNNSSTNASITVNPTSSTSYTVTVTNASGCTGTATTTVNAAPPPTASVAGNTTICTGQTSTLTASGGLTYTWNTAATTSVISVSPASNTTYSVIVSAGTCSDTASISVTVNPTPTAGINSSSSSVCTGTTGTLTATGGGTYLWNNGATTNVISVSPTANTTYTVTVTNASGCTSVATSALTVNSPPTATVNTASASICAGNSAALTASGGGTYSWNTGATTATINAATAGNYSVVVFNGGCSDTAYASVTVNANPNANAGTDVSVTNGNSITLGASGGGTYSWSTGQLTSAISVSPTATTQYCVIVTAANSCKDTDCVTVFVDLDCGDFFIPNAFSPNDDLKNDVVYVRSKCLKTMHFVIYDRWGSKVFETDDIKEGWDGKRGGVVENAAVYNYILNYELLTGEKDVKKGTISLIR